MYYVWLWLKGQRKSIQSYSKPLKEYTCVVWSPHTAKVVELLEGVQRYAARWSGLVVGVGTKLHLLGPFLMTHVTRCCAYLHCVLGMTIYQFVLSRTFVTIIPYLSWTILLTTLCLHVVIFFRLNLFYQQSMLEGILTLCMFASFETNFSLNYCKSFIVLLSIILFKVSVYC